MCVSPGITHVRYHLGLNMYSEQAKNRERGGRLTRRLLSRQLRVSEEKIQRSRDAPNDIAQLLRRIVTRYEVGISLNATSKTGSGRVQIEGESHPRGR